MTLNLYNGQIFCLLGHNGAGQHLGSTAQGLGIRVKGLGFRFSDLRCFAFRTWGSKFAELEKKAPTWAGAVVVLLGLPAAAVAHNDSEDHRCCSQKVVPLLLAMR